MNELTNIPMPVAALIASMIGATATITAAILQFRLAWKREMLARSEQKQVAKKTKRAPIRYMIILLVASAIGGFALSQYLVSEGRKKDDALEQDLRSRIDQLTMSAQRLENVRLYGQDDIMRQVRSEEAQRFGKDGVVTLIELGKCVRSAAPTDAACDEHSAMQIALCVEVPAAALVSALDFYVRTDDAPGAWSEKNQVVAGKDFGGGRFNDKPIERANNEISKQICNGLAYWNSEFAVQARMVARYVPLPATDNAAVINVPTAHKP